ncbi:MAG: hypothetical protein V3V08_12950 [Nannocystaceae bacterium]
MYSPESVEKRTPLWAHLRGYLSSHAGVGVIFLVFLAIGAADYNPRTSHLQARDYEAHSGDEPHYIVIINSLLYDGDLYLEDDYQSALHGGWEAGRSHRGRRIHHHTIVIDPATAHTQLWREAYDPHKPLPCDTLDCTPYRRRNGTGFDAAAKLRETPAHPPAFAALLAALIWPLAASPHEVELLAGWVLTLVALAAILVTYLAALASGMKPRSALAASALLALASPWLAYSKGYFSETTIGLALVAAIYFIAKKRALPAAIAISCAMILKPPFVLLGVAWLFDRLLARDWRTARTACLVMGLAGFTLVGFNAQVLGRVIVAGSRGWVGAAPTEDGAAAGNLGWIFSTTGWIGTVVANGYRNLLDDRHGLLIFVPWVAISAIIGVRTVLLRRGRSSVDQVIATGSASYLLLLSSFAGGLAGVCFGPRHWVAFLPLLALLAARAIEVHGAWIRWTLAALAVVSVAFSLPAGLAYRQIWHRHPWTALARMLPQAGPPVGAILYSESTWAAFKDTQGHGWVPADGRRVPSSSLYYLLFGLSHVPRIPLDGTGDKSYIRIN